MDLQINIIDKVFTTHRVHPRQWSNHMRTIVIYCWSDNAKLHPPIYSEKPCPPVLQYIISLWGQAMIVSIGNDGTHTDITRNSKILNIEEHSLILTHQFLWFSWKVSSRRWSQSNVQKTHTSCDYYHWKGLNTWWIWYPRSLVRFDWEETGANLFLTTVSSIWK